MKKSALFALRGLALPFCGLLAACGSGGSLTLEGSPRKVASAGSPNAAVNLGGKALVVEQGKTAATGVHGWVTIQSVSSKKLTAPDNTQMILNGSQAFQ